MQKEKIRYTHVDKYGYAWMMALDEPALFEDCHFIDGVSHDGGVEYTVMIQDENGELKKIGGASAKMM